MIIGLTGPSGSGKSTIASFLENKGALVLDADAINHDILSNNQEVIDEIRKTFGMKVITDNKIDRQELGQLVFSDSEKIKQLTDITHPVIVETIKNQLLASEQSIKVIDAPLLIEVNLHKLADEVWTVLADEDIRIKRLLKRDDRTETDIINRVKNQPDDEFYIQHAQKVFYNNKTEKQLLEDVRKHLKELGVTV